MKKILTLVSLFLVLGISCTETRKDTTYLNEKAFSLQLDTKWKKRYHEDSIILENFDEQLLFQTHLFRNPTDETEIKNTLLRLIEEYRKAELYKSGNTKIGENNYGDSNGFYFIRFVGNDISNRFFTVFLFGTPRYVLSVYFEKMNTTESVFMERAGEIINKIVIKQ